MQTRPYVGIDSDGFRFVFRSPTAPTWETHAYKFAACIGPFRTVRGADFCAKYGKGNPHIQCVADAERIAKLYA